MTPHQALGLAGLLFLLAFVLSIVMLNRRGRRLSLLLAEQQPDVYEELGRPLPTTFPSERRMHFDEFIMRRDYETLLDPDLARQFGRLRQLETRLLGLAVLILVVFAGAMFQLG
ncbi:MAG: hypothetical protein PVF05_11195 [Gemmatimonadales bacterium]|jgi:hypothetical protein